MKKNISVYYLISPFLAAFIIISLCLYLIPNTMTPILIGLGLAYAFDPLIDHFENKGFNRTLVVLIFFIIIGGVLFSLITLFIPYLFMQMTELLENFPAMLTQLLELISSKLQIDTLVLKEKVSLLIKQNYNSENVAKLTKLIKISVSSTSNWFTSMAGAIIIPVFFYFFLIDIDRIKKNIFLLIPKPYQNQIKIRLLKIDNVLSGFIRGQLMVACILALFYAISLSLIGVKYGFLIGFVSGLLNIIPYVGVFLGLSSSIFMAFFSQKIIITIILILLSFSCIQMVEGFVITPKIVGKKVGLSSLMTIIAILVGGELFGILGMLLAIPVGGIIRVIFRDLKAAYLKSKIYNQEKQ